MKTTLLLLTVAISSTIITGLKFLKEGKITTKSGIKKAITINVVAIIGLFVIGVIPDLAFAGAKDEAMAKAMTTQASGLGYLAAAISTGLAAIGAGIGVGQAGSAAIGAISEDSSILGKTLIILGLAEGVAIYGLVISIMILQKL